MKVKKSFLVAVVGILLVVLLVSIFYNNYFFQGEEDYSVGMMNNMGMMGTMEGHNHPMIYSEEQFVIEMVPHHQEAVDTALIIGQKTQNPELKELANNIVSTQTQEIEMMNNWKDDFYADSTYKASYQNMMPNLEVLEGSSADIAFLQGMIMHHQMAIMMAQQVLSLNPRKEVSDFVKDIISVQSEEISQMRDMLRDY